MFAHKTVGSLRSAVSSMLIWIRGPDGRDIFDVGANLVFALATKCKAVWRREKGEHKVRLYCVYNNSLVSVHMEC